MPTSTGTVKPSLETCLLSSIDWRETDNPLTPLEAVVDGRCWTLRINDFPDAQLFTLFCDNDEIGDFDDWPSAWTR